MKKILLSIILLFVSVAASVDAQAGTRASSLLYKTHDGKMMRGFIMQNEKTAKDAPVAILMHGMNLHMFHWIADGFPTYGGQITEMLLKRGYRVVALDARVHGYARKEGNAIKYLKQARRGAPAHYYGMIENTVKDYEFILKRLKEKFGQPRHILTIGYSMGAQMGIMFAAKNPEVTHLVAIVPPHTGNKKKVSPVEFAPRVKAQWLLLTAKKDDFNSPSENDEIEAAIQTPYKRVAFDSGHLLPEQYVKTVADWVAAIDK